jgi:hypothetical protein
MTRAVTPNDLGAWLIKCDPRVNSELLAPRDGGVAGITSPCVVPGYRALMMQRGERVVLWKSGADRRTRGIRGVGSVTVSWRMRTRTSPSRWTSRCSQRLSPTSNSKVPAGSNPSRLPVAQLEQVAPLLHTRARVRTHPTRRTLRRDSQSSSSPGSRPLSARTSLCPERAGHPPPRPVRPSI